MTRKDFFRTIVRYTGGAIGIAVVGCGSSGGGGGGSADGPGASCLQNGTSVTIAANHGHVLVVAKADVMASVDKTYDIMGTAIHTHSVTLTAANFASLAANHSVMVTSSLSSAHTHDIMVVCV